MSSKTQKYYARVQNACLQEYASGGAFLKVAFLFKILFLKIFKLTHTLKTAQKVVLDIFEINLKIN